MNRFKTASLPRCAFILMAVATFLFGVAAPAQTSTTPTTVTVSSTVQRSSMKRLGINLGTPAYYDSGQIMKNLTFRNPGFEGETWQSTIHCMAVTATSCTDDNQYSAWPAGFFIGAQATFIYGANDGQTTTVTANTAANSTAGTGVTITFGALPNPVAVGDYIVVRMTIPGNAQSGWWTDLSGGATLATDFTDLSPETPGKQALEINASTVNSNATVSSYFDSTPGRSFIQLNGTYAVTFRAKGLGGNNQVIVGVQRLATSGPSLVYLSQTVNLTNSWQDYTCTFSASEVGAVGTAQLSFAAAGGSLYLDDVSLTKSNTSPTNSSAVRDEVVSTLQSLHPGIIRYMDSGTNWGSSIDNMLAPAFARTRPGYSDWNTESDDTPALSIEDFLLLCETVGAEPWYTMQTGMSPQDMSNLMDFLGGSTATPYGALRASMGQTAPWTSVFPVIHLEFGNEVWNSSNAGALMTDPVAYGTRAAEIFAAAHASSSYSPSSFDLVLDGWGEVPSWTQQVLSVSSNYDTIDAAPYVFDTFDDASSIEAIYGPMFAEPELIDDTTNGYMYQDAQVVAAAPHPTKLAIYESNVATLQGTVSQAAINEAVPSVGAGLTATEHMLLMMRDLGIVNQNMFALAGYDNVFVNPSSTTAESSPVYGTVVDMGNTNAVRPNFLSEELANKAILPTMLATTQTGNNPTWNQPLSTNDNVALNGAHYLQSFAFTDGTNTNLILFNLSRTTALPVTLAGPNAPVGSVSLQTLTSANITDNNENGTNVVVASSSATLAAGQTLTLAPFSMTVISSSAATTAAVSQVSVICAPTSVNIGSTAACSATVVGTGSYSSAVTWTTSGGAITNSGTLTAPLTEGAVTVTATSTANPSMTGSATVTVTASGVPIISNVVVSPLTPTSATVTWDTSVPATGGVNWGTTPAYQITVPAATGSSLSTSYTLSGLNPSTIYYVELFATDSAGSGTATLTVTTPAQPSITATCTPAAVAAGSTAACTETGTPGNDVVWTTNLGAISSTGAYTAPASVTGRSQVATVTATSTIDPTAASSTTITVDGTTQTASSTQQTAVATQQADVTQQTTATTTQQTNVTTPPTNAGIQSTDKNNQQTTTRKAKKKGYDRNGQATYEPKS